MKKENIVIKCKDNFVLAGVVYRPDKLKSAVLIAPATGIKKGFYNSFATYLSKHGYGVICFDNRGIGDSKGKSSINDGKPSLIAWGKFDLTAAFLQLQNCFPNNHYQIIGHSAGGQLIGLMDDVSQIKSLFNFASSSGSLTNMSGFFKLQAMFFLNVFIPINNLLFGYTKSHLVGMGDPLPIEVARQWSKWCNGTGYVAVDFNEDVQDHLYDAITAPSMWVHSIDDGIANLINVKDMIRIYSNSPAQIKTLIPSENGYKDIGHMKFFRSSCSGLWKIALEWLDQQS